MLIEAIAKAVRNLFMPGILRLVLLCLLAYGVGWIGFAWLAGAALAGLSGTLGQEAFFVQALGTLGGGVVAWFLFPLLYPLLMSFFDDYMAEVIETRDYPQLPKATPPFWPTLWYDALFTLKALAINVLCFPFYLIPLVGWLLYYSINGYLLGAQFFRMAAGRRVSKPATEELLSKHRGVIVLAGATVSFCSTIPLLNLAAPLLGVAVLLHLFHGVRGTGKMEIL